MTTPMNPDATGDNARDWVAPEACTLPTTEQPLRVAETDDLFRHRLESVDRLSPTSVRMRLAGPSDLAATVRDLTDRETACCSFFTFTVTSGGAPGTDLTLDIEVPADRVDVLAALVDRADTGLAAHGGGGA